MAHRKPRAAFELMHTVSALPWWMGLALAALVFLVLQLVAQPAAATPYRLVQFAIPFLCIVAAGVSFVRRRYRTRLLQGVASSAHADTLSTMPWHDFEVLVGEAFRLQGYEVRGGPDARADIELRREGETFLVQLKQWRQDTVGVAIVREFYGVMARAGVSGGFLVTSGHFSDDAVAFAQDTHLQLVDGSALFALLKRSRSLSLGRR